jgi:hypothetical protein
VSPRASGNLLGTSPSHLATRPQTRRVVPPARQNENSIRARVSGLADLEVSQVGTNDFKQAIRGRTRRKEANVLAVSAH